MLPDRIDATGGQALGVIALSLTRRLNLGDKLRVYRGEADGKERRSRALRPPRRSRAQIGTVARQHRGAAERANAAAVRSEEHTSELQSHSDLVCGLLLEK